MRPVRSLRVVLCKASQRPSWTDPWMGALLSGRKFDGDFSTANWNLIIITIIIIIIIRRRRRVIITA